MVKKPILALLQNQWFKDPKRVEDMLRGRSEAFRRSFISHALFAGCKSGKVLSKYFGDYLDMMVFEETSRIIGGFASSKFKPDLAHVANVIKELEPTIIIGFGSLAKTALLGVDCGEAVTIFAPHPTARSGVLEGFDKALKELDTAISQALPFSL